MQHEPRNESAGAAGARAVAGGRRSDAATTSAVPELDSGTPTPTGTYVFGPWRGVPVYIYPPQCFNELKKTYSQLAVAPARARQGGVSRGL
jgi:hypothetical protein